MNLAVSVGDLLVCTIVADSSTTASIVLSNSTTDQAVTFGVTAPTGTTLVGSCAEWIVERPSFGGVLSQLANYNSVTFQEAFGGTNDAYRCPAGEKLIYHYTNEEDDQQLRRYWTNACRDCALKASCTTGKERRITRWEHEHVLEEAQRRLDNNPHAMRQRRETVEHPFGTMKARMGATHFLTKTLPKVAAEMALSVLAYNLTRVMNIIGIKPLIAAIVA